MKFLFELRFRHVHLPGVTAARLAGEGKCEVEEMFTTFETDSVDEGRARAREFLLQFRCCCGGREILDERLIRHTLVDFESHSLPHKCS